jgi:hypothetical protein
LISSTSASTESLPPEARKLLEVITRLAREGPLRSKAPGVVTMPEVHEACGLDVDHMYSLLRLLLEARLIEMEGEYPFEEIKPVPWIGPKGSS